MVHRLIFQNLRTSMVTEVTSYQPNLKMHSFIDTDISEMGAIEKQIPTI